MLRLREERGEWDVMNCDVRCEQSLLLSDSREPSDGREQDWLGPIPRGGVEWCSKDSFRWPARAVSSGTNRQLPVTAPSLALAASCFAGKHGPGPGWVGQDTGLGGEL